MAGIVEKIKDFLFSPSESCKQPLSWAFQVFQGGGGILAEQVLLGLGSLRKEPSEMLPRWCRGGVSCSDVRVMARKG